MTPRTVNDQSSYPGRPLFGMAELYSISVKDFRAFRDASFEFGSNGLVLIAGPNSAGKSALMSALDVVAGQEAPAALLHVVGQRAHVRARFWLNKDERATLVG